MLLFWGGFFVVFFFKFLISAEQKPDFLEKKIERNKFYFYKEAVIKSNTLEKIISFFLALANVTNRAIAIT